MSRSSFSISRIVAIVMAALLLITTSLLPVKTAAGTGQVSTHGAGGESTNAWTNPQNARGTNDDDTYATASPAANSTVTGIWNGYDFNSSLPLHAVITKVEIIPQYKVNNMLTDIRLQVQARVNGSDCPSTPFTDSSRPTTDTDLVVDVTSCRSWTRADLLDANFATKLGAQCVGVVPCTSNFTLDYVKTTVTYTIPDYDQVAYRWFDNTDSTNVGTPLAGNSAAPTLYAPRDYLRLRLLVKVSTTDLLINSEEFKLQFGPKSGTCGGATFADVTTSSGIAYYNNPAPSSGVQLTTNAGDPTYPSTTVITQSYSETNPFVTLANTAVGQAGIWDVALHGNGAAADTTYCLRLVMNDGRLLANYSVYAEVTTSSSGSLTVDFIDNLENSIASPSISFAAMIAPVVCETSTSTLGVAEQKIRIKNTTDTASWSVNIAATDGSSALWSAGTPKYDFNDPTGSPAGCSAGLDADTYAGQMSFDPSVATITPRAVSACTNTGVSKGSSAAFNEGVINALTLVSASGSAKTGCYWDLSGIVVSQQVPGGQPPGSYSLGMTVTVLAS